MARPKERAACSEAFQQRCCTDGEKQRSFQAESLAADIQRMLTEGLHTDLVAGCSEEEVHSAFLHFSDSTLEPNGVENMTHSKKDQIPLPLNSGDGGFNKTAGALETNRPSTETRHSALDPSQEGNQSSLIQSDIVLTNGIDGDTGKQSSCVKCTDNQVLSETVNCTRSLAVNSTEARLTLEQLLDKKYGVQAKVTPCSPLGRDLLYLWLEQKKCDCIIDVNGERFPVHRCILSARSPYFAAMLSGSWQESDMETIVLNGLDSGVVCQLLLYVYGGVVDIVDTCPLGSLMQLADMYSMDGLKEVVNFNLNMQYCHFFHKPCPECISGVPETLALSMMFHLELLRDRCLRWINKHKLKVWETKTFATLPPEVLELCVQTAVKDLTVDTVLDTLVECGQLNCKLPKLRWTEVLFYMVTSLMDAAIEFASTHFVRLLSSNMLQKLDKQGLAFNRQPIEEIFSQVIGALSPEMSCHAYILLYQYVEAMNQQEERDDARIRPPFSEDCEGLVRALYKRCREHMCTYIHQVAHTADWELLTKDQQSDILAEANYVCFDTNKGKMSKPKLSSMQKKPPASNGMSLTEYLKCWFEPKTPPLPMKSAKSAKRDTSTQQNKSSPHVKQTVKSTAVFKSQTKTVRQTAGKIIEPKAKTGVKGTLLKPKESGSKEKLFKSSTESFGSTGSSNRIETSLKGKSVDNIEMKSSTSSIDRMSQDTENSDGWYDPFDIRNYENVVLVDLPSPIYFPREQIIPILSVVFSSL